MRPETARATATHCACNASVVVTRTAIMAAAYVARDFMAAPNPSEFIPAGESRKSNAETVRVKARQKKGTASELRLIELAGATRLDAAARHQGCDGRTANDLRVIRGVFLDELDLVGRNFLVGEDGIGRADWHASAAVNAAVRVDIQLSRRLKRFLILLGMDAIGWASFNAEFVFGTGISDGVRHDCCSPRSC